MHMHFTESLWHPPRFLTHPPAQSGRPGTLRPATKLAKSEATMNDRKYMVAQGGKCCPALLRFSVVQWYLKRLASYTMMPMTLCITKSGRRTKLEEGNEGR